MESISTLEVDKFRWSEVWWTAGDWFGDGVIIHGPG